MLGMLNRFITDLNKNRKEILLGLSFYMMGVFSVFVAGVVLDEHFGAIPRSPDLLLDSFDQIKAFIIIGEVAVVLNMGLLFYSMFQDHLKWAGEFIAKAGILYMLRGLAIILTPLAQIQTDQSHTFPLFNELYHGMFFSGHTGLAFLIYFTDKSGTWTKKAKLALAIIVALSLILSHSHYSIDIFGGILVAYALDRTKILSK